MIKRAVLCAGLLPLLFLGSCQSDDANVSDPGVGNPDASADGDVTVLSDAPADKNVPLEGGNDSAPEANAEAGPDAAQETGADAAQEADAGLDAAEDVSLEAGPDAAEDVSVEAGPDATPEAGPDAFPWDAGVTGECLIGGTPVDCSKRLNELAFAGAHNAFSYGFPDCGDACDNQYIGIKDQLEGYCPKNGHYKGGARFLLLDIHGSSGSASMCHETNMCCPTPGCHRPFAAITGTIKTWLENNPREILWIQFENYDSTGLSVFDSLAASGLLKYVYHDLDKIRSNGYVWPRLGELVFSNRRLILVHGNNDITYEAFSHDQKYFMWDNYGTKNTYDSNECGYYCQKNDPSLVPESKRLYTMSHFPTTGGAISYSQMYNHCSFAAGDSLSLGNHVAMALASNVIPNFISIDWYHGNGIGDSLTCVDHLVDCINKYGTNSERLACLSGLPDPKCE